MIRPCGRTPASVNPTGRGLRIAPWATDILVAKSKYLLVENFLPSVRLPTTKNYAATKLS